MLQKKAAMNIKIQAKAPIKQYILLVCLFLLYLASPLAFAADYISDAKEAMAKEEYTTAIIHLKNQVKQKPDDATARYLLGRSYEKTGNISGAIKEFERAYKLDKQSSKIQLAYASMLLLINDKEKIKSILATPYSAKEEESERLVILGTVALNENKLADATELLSKAKEINDSVAVQIMSVKIAIAEKDYSRARQIVEEILKEDNQNTTALHLKAGILDKEKKYDESLSILNALVESEPDNLRFLLDRAAIKYKLKDYKGVEQDILTILKQNDKLPSANSLMALAKLYQKDYKSAIEYAQKVLNIMPDHYISMYVMGISEFVLGNLNQAEKYLNQILFQFPDHVDAQNVLANVYIAKQEGEQALLILESIEPSIIDTNANLLLSQGTAYLLTGDNEKAIIALNKAKKIAPNNKLIDSRLVLGYFKSKDAERSLSGLEAIASNKDNKQAQYMLILSYIQQEKLDQAQSKIKEFQKQSPNDPNLFNFQAAIYLLNKNQQLALESYHKALSVNENYIPAYLGMVRIYMANQQFDKADELFKKILSINDKYIKAWLGRAAIAENSGDSEKVEFFIKEGVKKSQGDLNSELIALEQLSRWYKRQGQQEKVLELGRDFVQRYPDKASAQFFQVKSLLLNGKKQQAEAPLEKLLYNDPDNSKYQLLLIRLLMEKKDYQRALSLLDTILEADPEDRQALLLKGNILVATEKNKEVVQVGKYYQQVYPEEAEGYQLEGSALLVEKQYKSALDKYKIAFNKEANNRVLLIIIDLYLREQKTNEAIEFLKKVIVADESNIAARYRLAILLQQEKLNALAIEQYQAILKYDSENILALNNLAWILSEQGDKQALKYAQSAYQLKPGAPAILDTYGYILLQEGRLEEGVKLLEQAANSAPEAYDIHYHLAKGYFLRGDKQKAKEKLMVILSAKTDFSEKENAQALFNQLQ